MNENKSKKGFYQNERIQTIDENDKTNKIFEVLIYDLLDTALQNSNTADE